MNKLITRLSTELAKELSIADEIFIAVALLNDKGLNFLLQDLKDSCKTKLLVGIDLPTTPEVLRRLKELENVDVRIYSNNNYFHPKLYAFKTGDDTKIFVGSSNFTNGGLNDNIELSLFSSDKDACNDALEWFSNAFSSSKILSDEFLDEYETLYVDREIHRETEKKNVKKLKKLLTAPSKDSSLELLTNEYYFIRKDYETFHPDKVDKNTSPIIDERERVRQKMFELERGLYKKINEKGWKIYRHPKLNNRVSLIELKYNKNYVNSMWLHFGKKGKERDDSFIENIRLQVIISGNLRLSSIGYGVGVWLMVGKENSSLEDRNFIKNSIQNNSFLEKLYKYILSLGNGYFLQLNNENYPCESIEQDFLYKLIKEDDYKSYFIIGKNFSPNDKFLKSEKIYDTIMDEFAKLYPLYLMLKI